MAKEDENFLRASLLLLKGGTLVSKETLKIEVNKSGKIIDDLLKPFQKKLYHKTVKRQREKLFPQSGTGTNIEVWDIAMLVTVLLTVFKDSLDDDQKDHLKTIKAIRDEVYAHSPSSSLSNDDYDDIRQRLEQAYLSLSSLIGNDKKDECYDIIQKCTADPINPEELKKQLENQEDLFQVVINKLNDHKQSLLEMRDEIMAKLDSIIKKEDRSTKTITVVDTKLTLSGAINEKDDIDFAEDILTKVLNEAIKRAGGDKDYTKIRKVVDKMLEDIGNLPDVEIQPAEHKCIILKFKCCSYLGLQTILEYLHSETLKNILKELAISLNSIGRMKSEHINIEAEVTLECLKVILDTLRSAMLFPVFKYDKQDQQGNAALNERNPHMTQQQEPVARSPGGPQTKTGQGKDRAQTGSSTVIKTSASTRKPRPPDFQDPKIDFDQKAAIELADAFKSGGMSKLNKKIEEDVGKWRKVPVNIAVTGNSGAGKSSFINSFRGLKAKAEGAAAVGVNETTMEPTKYMHPKNNSTALWDLPGIGTQKFPKETYLEKVDFVKYDFFLIITSKRFTENDIWLAKEVKKQNKKFFFIRTKMNEDVKNEAEDHGTSKSDTVNKVREEMTQDVAKEHFENVKVYLIDNRGVQDYDFPILTETMIREAPSWKQEAIALTLTNLTEDLINRKRSALRKRIMVVSLGSAGGAAIPVPGVSLAIDTALIVKEVEFYKQQFGLDDESLQKTSSSLKLAVGSLLERLNSGLTSMELVSKWGAILVASESAERITAIVLPVLGSIIAAGISYGSTVSVLLSILDDCVSDAYFINKQLMQKMSDKSETCLKKDFHK